MKREAKQDVDELDTEESCEMLEKRLPSHVWSSISLIMPLIRSFGLGKESRLGSASGSGRRLEMRKSDARHFRMHLLGSLGNALIIHNLGCKRDFGVQ